MTLRHDSDTDSWPLRPWIMAAICAVGGLIFHSLTDHHYPDSVPAVRQAAATFVAITTVSFVMTVEQRRWLWSIAFAAGWGAVVALVGWFTAGYNSNPTIFEWPFLSGLFAVLLAAPLFQTVRDEGAWRFPYTRLHTHAWTDAVIGAAALVFVGISFLLAWLIAGLFDLIGLDFIKKLLQKDWFGWVLAGFALGAAVGLLRERDALVATLQRLVMVVLGVLAPVLAAALLLFLLSIPFTGLGKLWDSDIPATPMMLLAGAGAVLLANAVIGNGADDRATSRVLRISAQVLVLAVLPLAIIAALSIGQRIGQYGLTPERMWGVVAVGVAIGYGLVGWWVVAKGRNGFDDLLRPLQTKLALGLCALALFLALPIVDFGALSASSQLARLEAGKVKADEFDWSALAFQFGPAGRAALTRIAQTGSGDAQKLASKALKSGSSYDVERATQEEHKADNLEQYIHIASPDIRMTDELRRELARRSYCQSAKQCVLFRADPHRLILVSASGIPAQLGTQVIDERDLSSSSNATSVSAAKNNPSGEGVDLDRAKIEIREVPLKLVYVNGQPVGDPFE
jgi:hypothetical protein